jgi:hypothetical protein
MHFFMSLLACNLILCILFNYKLGYRTWPSHTSTLYTRVSFELHIFFVFFKKKKLVEGCGAQGTVILKLMQLKCHLLWSSLSL